MQQVAQSLIIFPTGPDDIIHRAKKAIAQTKKVEDSLVGAVSPDTSTFETVILPLIRDENERRLEERVLGILSSVSPTPDLREASLAAARLFDEANTESFLREDVFRLVDAVICKGQQLDTESAHYLQRRHRKYLEYGLQIKTTAERERVQTLRQRIGELTRMCQKNFNGRSEGIWLEKSRLGGIEEHVLNRLVQGKDEQTGSVWYPLKSNEVTALLRNVSDSEIRKRVFLAAERTCSQNKDLMKELFLARDEMARLLGYSSYASLQLKDNVARTPENVESFLEDMRLRLEPHAQEQLAQLMEMKKADSTASDKQSLHYWDFPYYRGQILKQRLGVDHDEVSEYFLFEEVLQGLLREFERLLHVKISPVSQNCSNLTWHPDVSILSILDKLDGEEAFLGYIYLDLHPRELKRPKGGHWRLHPGYLRADNIRHCPSSAIVFNVAKSTENKPSLMRHAEVISLFHELGHGFRNIVTKTKFAASHGGYDTDFIETPSKLLDHRFWTAGPLKRIGRHYSYVSSSYQAEWEARNATRQNPRERPPERISEGMMTGLLSSRYQCEAVDKLRQVALAKFALAVHNRKTREEMEDIDLTAMYNELRDKHTMLTIGNEDPGHNYTTFSHVFGHWAAAYYSYLHSTAIAADLFRSEAGFNGNPDDEVTGLRWRRIVLEPGGSRPQAGLLEEFLGREPSNDLFIAELTQQG